MTEQSKIPVPPEGAKGRKTLIERAEETFTLDGFKPAMIPEALRQSALRMRRKLPPVAAAVPVAITGEAQAQNVDGPAPAVTVAPAVEPAAEPAAGRIHFRGTGCTIDRAKLAAAGMIVPDGRVSALQEEFRIVKRQVLQSARPGGSAKHDPSAQCVLVSSPLPGEGKSFCSVNLALSLAAEKDTEVLLVDADFANPSVPSLLGVEAGPGLMDALSDLDVAVEDCVLATDIPNLFLLPAGNRTATDSEYLASARMGELFNRLIQGAPNRIVIFDSPPALAASPAAELAKLVGQALVVVRADQTGQSALEDCLSLLSTCPEIKLLLNGTDFSPSGRRFGDYYGYGKE